MKCMRRSDPLTQSQITRHDNPLIRIIIITITLFCTNQYHDQIHSGRAPRRITLHHFVLKYFSDLKHQTRFPILAKRYDRPR